MASLGNKKVLLVARESARVEALTQQLCERGYQVFRADNGATGLLAAHAEKPALTLVEGELPVMDGYQMLEVLRSDPATRHLSIFILAAGADDGEMARGWLSGADFCLPKDCAVEDLMLMIQRTLLLDRTAEYSLVS